MTGAPPISLPFGVAESEIPYCTVLKHEINRGKGAALKTAFEFVG